MGYLVHKHYKRKDGTYRWRIILEQEINGERDQQNISKSQWADLGVRPDMTIEEARAILKPLNLRIYRDKSESKAVKTKKRLQKEANEESEFLPPLYVKQFERDILFRRLSFGGQSSEVERLKTHWRATQRLIKAIKMHPDEWCDAPEVIFHYFVSKRYSLSYSEKILRILNEWGIFMTKRRGGAFWAVKPPRGRVRERINDAYYEKPANKKKSEPISPKELQSAKGKLSSEQFNFMFVCMWFGLRPGEAEMFYQKNEQFWKIIFDQKNQCKVLWVYQPKLVSLPRAERWKLIPVLFAEQEKALEIIEAGALEKPLVKTIKKHVKEEANNYGGRKGFRSLMKSKGQILEDISAWLGHRSLDRTWRDYTQHMQVSITKKAGND